MRWELLLKRMGRVLCQTSIGPVVSGILTRPHGVKTTANRDTRYGYDYHEIHWEQGERIEPVVKVLGQARGVIEVGEERQIWGAVSTHSLAMWPARDISGLNEPSLSTRTQVTLS